MEKVVERPVGRVSALSLRGGWLAIYLSLLGMLAAEVGLQVRSHLKTGYSLFSAVQAQPGHAIDPETGLKIYPPNSVIRGANIVVETNQFGFRSPPVAEQPTKDELRIAVLGASTVAGAYTPANEQLFSQKLASLLRDRHAGPVNVINAGIPGYTVADMHRLMERRIVKLKPQIVVLYAGFNDFAKLCKAAQSSEPVTAGLWFPSLPGELLLPDLVKKNTVGLRSAAIISRIGFRKNTTVSEAALASYRAEVEGIARVAKRNGIELIVVPSLAAYRENMPRAQQMQLSQTARYYHKCFDLDGLISAGRQLNAIQASVAQEYGFDVLDVSSALPGGSETFADSSHFTVKGERLMAWALYNRLATKLN